MSTILLAYEFGGGLGHVSRLSAVAQRLDPRHKLVFALPRAATHRAALEKAFASPIDVVDGVLWQPPPSANQGSPTHIMADTLNVYGYGELERLLAASLRWMSILARFSPDLIVADAAPTLRLVSQPRIPTVVLGSGYGIPPARQPMGPIRPWANELPPSSRSHEGQVLAAMNQVREHLSGPPVDFVADLFQGERTFVCTLPEFDPYARARLEPQTWPFNVPRMPQDLPGEREIAVFCYLPNAHPSLNQILGAVRSLDLRSELYISGADPHAISRQSSTKTRIHTKPADLSAVLPQTRLLVHPGGLGTTFSGLVAGVPQLLVPLALEQQVTAHGLGRFGCSRRLEHRADAAVIKSGLEQMLADQNLLVAASRAKQQIEARRVPDPIADIVATCEALV